MMVEPGGAEAFGDPAASSSGTAPSERLPHPSPPHTLSLDYMSKIICTSQLSLVSVTVMSWKVTALISV